MQVSVDTIKGLERQMHVALPHDEIDTEIGKRLQDLRKKVRLHGFRPGKIPMSVIKKRYGVSVRQEVIGMKVETLFPQALQQEKLSIAGPPKIDLNEESGTFTATFEIYPEITLADLSQTPIDRWVCEVTDQNVEQTLEKLRKSSAKWHVVNRPAALGDQVTIDMKGLLDGQPFPQGDVDGMKLELGSKQMIEGFEDQLLGHGAGDKVEMDLAFPEQYPVELAGKAVHFSIAVKDVCEIELPELDTEFVKSLGEDGDIASFKQEVRRNLESRMTQSLFDKIKSDVMSLLIEKHPIELPQVLVDSEAKSLAQHAQSGKIPEAMLQEQAKRRVLIGLVLSQIVSEHNILVDQDRVKAKIEQMAESYQNPQQLIDSYQQNEAQRHQMESLVIEEQVVDWVLNQATITDKAIDLDILLDAGGQGNLRSKA